VGEPSDILSPRDAAGAIVRRLRAHGFTAYLAGGCVRDELLGQVPKDFDVATDARPDDIRPLFKRTAEVGAAFGVMLVREFGPTVEVATFRDDGSYSDKRRPDSVSFSDARRDALRRDFTVNALFIDPTAEGDDRVIDFVDGRADLTSRTLRAVGDPDKRLGEDHLRALRGVRFAARYGLAIEERTAGAMRRHAGALEGVSRERIGEEVRRMLTHASRGRAAALLHELGLAGAVFGPVGPDGGLGGGSGGGWDGRVMDALAPDASYVAALMALLIGRGVTVEGPGRAGDAARGLRRALLLSNAERDGLRDGLATLGVLRGGWDAMGEAGRKRLASGGGFADAFAVLAAADPARGHAVGAEVERLRGRFGGLCPDAWVDGGVLISLGLRPGPRFAEILDAVYDAQLEGRASTAQEAIELARSMAAG